MRISRPTLFVVLCLPGWFTPTVAQDHRRALLQTDGQAAQLASDSGFPAALRQVLQPDGVLLWPDAPVLTGSQVYEFLGSRFRSAPPKLTWQPMAVELSADSALAALWGVAVLSPPSPAGSPSIGRFISVWKRDGAEWSMSGLVLIGITFPAATALPPGIALSRPAARFSREAQPFVAADLGFARLAQDSGAATAFRSWAHDDALIFGGGGLLTRGPAAIGRAVDGPAQWNWHPVLADGALSEDLGWTVGEAIIKGSNGDPSYSKYLTVWTRRGGATRFVLDGGNPRPRAR